MDKTKIAYYAFPFHIDMVERTILQLKRASNYSNTKEYLCLDIVLDISDENFEWDKCDIPKQFFIDKFKYLEKYCDFCLEVNFRVDDILKSSGAHQRQILEENNGEYNLIWLDPDISFPIEIFYILENIIPTIEENTSTYMITPQIAKFWDSSWDIISNEKYINSPIEFDNINVYELDTCDVDNIELIKNYNHKFAGGWFNFHSKELTKLMKLPESVGIFHHIDLFQQEKFKILNQKGHDIPQYIIKNCIILEDRKYSHKNDFWTKYIPLKSGSSGYSQDPDLIFQEIVKELKKLQNG
mgnify:CR=1 FL=1|tara:strand:+ start:4877 stop:5770 length:894 start_codon:yes stop_codon:yes gene_type:complete